jgi:hypothetical protein
MEIWGAHASRIYFLILTLVFFVYEYLHIGFLALMTFGELLTSGLSVVGVGQVVRIEGVFCIDANDEEWAMRMNGLNLYLKFKAKCGEEKGKGKGRDG